MSRDFLREIFIAALLTKCTLPSEAAVYDTILDAILTHNQKLTRVSSIYRTEPATKKWENRKSPKSKKKRM